MRRAARIDGNHNAIVLALERVGASVWSLAREARGCPDIMVGFQDATYLMEIKDSSKPPSERRLTPDQWRWRNWWRGSAVHIVTTVDEALHVIGVRT